MLDGQLRMHVLTPKKKSTSEEEVGLAFFEREPLENPRWG
jgi:hypothetical protein